ncbi:hypothetical protein HPP92_004428 [Vanilla planifolia]|uniref:Uncharacterized protein n=1 Tax=Vanilla planifolia TaxID=51239 RepID=A0A835RJ53_VANPL|nr:hypothetical protein HPP92_004841 [Vanilla planifolia]KAG0493434.1 hypothetical protein HPP92_004428 [Vanilla planifolia]
MFYKKTMMISTNKTPISPSVLSKSIILTLRFPPSQFLQNFIHKIPPTTHDYSDECTKLEWAQSIWLAINNMSKIKNLTSEMTKQTTRDPKPKTMTAENSHIIP